MFRFFVWGSSFEENFILDRINIVFANLAYLSTIRLRIKPRILRTIFLIITFSGDHIVTQTKNEK